MPPLTLRRPGEVGGKGGWKYEGRGKRERNGHTGGEGSSMLRKLCRNYVEKISTLIIYNPVSNNMTLLFAVSMQSVTKFPSE